MQRSEGGGLGVGGSTSGLMSARGAADFLTRATAVLATLFVLLSIVLAGLAAVDRSGTTSIDTLLAPEAAPAAPTTAPAELPLAPGARLAGIAAKPANAQAAPTPQGAVPLAA